MLSRSINLLSQRRALSRMATATNNVSNPGPVEAAIRNKLDSQLRPSELIITNESWQHRHHAPMKAEGGGSGETHFSLQVVSDIFKGKKTTMQRHRMIYSTLSEEFSQGLHALSLKTKTPEEVQSTYKP